jgi:hypothetical protein
VLTSSRTKISMYFSRPSEMRSPFTVLGEICTVSRGGHLLCGQSWTNKEQSAAVTENAFDVT